MLKSIKTKWVKALRSGKYKQGTCQLKDKDSYCCLGVLASIVDPQGKTWCGDDGYFANKTISGAWKEPQSEQQSKILGKGGLGPGVADKLAAFNDGGKKSFNWIASYIERYVH